jgi:uroporphyrinogen-III synthase
MRRVLVLRPEPGASVTVERARARGLDAVAVPLFEIEPVEWQAPPAAAFDALLLTSANAVRFGGEPLKELLGLPVYAVGAATAEAAREAGFEIVRAGDGGVDRLLASIDPELKLLHIAGENRRDSEQRRRDITTLTVYRSRAKERVDLSAARNSIALVHSPRAARRLAELVGTKKSAITIAAISAEAADAAGPGWAAVEAADVPSDEGLLALAERLCNKVRAT